MIYRFPEYENMIKKKKKRGKPFMMQSGRRNPHRRDKNNNAFEHGAHQMHLHDSS
jgi:hypothetical protein